MGTVYYRAPEIIEEKEYDGEKIDIFSIGALLFILMTKKFGFVEAKIYDTLLIDNRILYKLIKEKKYDEYWELVENNLGVEIDSEPFKNLYLKLVAYNPEERPNIDQIKNDEWMKDIINVNPEQLIFLRKKMINQIKPLDEQVNSAHQLEENFFDFLPFHQN